MKDLIISNIVENNNAIESFIEFLDVDEDTIRSYKSRLEQFILFLRQNSISKPERKHIKMYRNNLKQSKSTNTVNNHMTAIRQFFRYLESNGLYKNVTDNVKNLKSSNAPKTQILTEKQCKEIYKSLTDKREKALWSLAITTGMRVNEIVNSKIENIKMHNGEIVLFHICKKRNDETEYNKISETVLKDILECVGERENGYIFTSNSNRNKGGGITPTSARRIIKGILKRFGIEADWVSCHTLRRTSATLAYLNGKSIYDIKQYLHHSSISTTSRYIQQVTRDTNNTENVLSELILG